MNRGEIWTAAGSGYATKPRPVLILQADEYAETDSVSVLLLTSEPVDAKFLRIPIAANTATGLDHDSFIMIDKIMTIRRASVVKRIGIAPQNALREVNRAVATFLGLTGQ